MGDWKKQELEMKCNEFIKNELGDLVFDDVNFAIFYKSDKSDMDKMREYNKIRKIAKEGAVDTKKIISFTEVSNGYIIELKAIKSLIKKTVTTDKDYDGIRDTALQMVEEFGKRRNDELNTLLKYLITEYNKGNKKVELVIYANTSNNKININALDQHDRKVLINYKGFLVTLDELNKLNDALIEKKIKFRVSDIVIKSILPNKKGLTIEITLV